jgi:integrase
MISSPRTAQTPVMKMENSKPRKRDRDGLYQRKGRGPWYFKFENPVGSSKWFARSTGTSVYNEAKQERMQFLGDIKKNRLPNERAKWTLQAAVDDYLADRRYRIKPGSYRSEACIVGSLLNILGADETLQSLAHITPIRRYQNTRLAAGIKPKSVNNEILCLSSVLREAKLWWKVENDYKKLKVDVNDEIDALTLEEQQRLLQVARSADPNAVAPYVAVLSYSTGMRHKEIRLLQLSAIQELNTEYPIIRVRRSTTKTNAGARPVSLDSMAVWAARKLLERAKRVGATEPNHYLLPTFLERHSRPTDPLYGKGKGFDPEHPMGSWQKEWNSFRKAVGIKHRHFHLLRHTYCTRAGEAGVPLAVTQSQVGHMSQALTAHYTHVSERAIHKAAQRIELHSADLMKHLGLASTVAEMEVPQ